MTDGGEPPAGAPVAEGGVTGHGTMDIVPSWAVSVIAVAIELSPGLEFLIACPIGRFLRRVLGDDRRASTSSSLAGPRD